MKLYLTGETAEIMQGAQIVAKKVGATICDDGAPVHVSISDDGLKVGKNADGYYIAYSFKAEFFRAFALLCANIKKGTDFEICEKRQFETVGNMLDVSRGFVFKKEVVFDLIERMALMGLNMFMLYTEDTYELEGYPWFGYMRGAYTKEELSEIDAYGELFGVEIIPCIQTLGHLAKALRWPAMNPVKDTASELLVGEEATYELIEQMFRTMRSCFRTKRIHIGMDEAMSLGTGKYLQLHGRRTTAEIMTEHLERVCKIAEKYDFLPMIWSDMFFRMSGKGGEYDTTAEIPANLKDDLPKNLEMVYWDYCMEDRKITDKVLSMHEEMERPVVFAGGIWTWNRLLTCFKKSFDTASEQVRACLQHRVSTLIATTWSNTNSHFSLYSTLPALQIWAELSYHVDADVEWIGERFHDCTGYSFGDWSLLFGDDFTDEEKEKYEYERCFCINSSFQHFHNDILIGLMDKTLSGYDFKAKYDHLRKAIAKADCGDMPNLFERHRLVYEICYLKCDLGTRLRTAYKNGDRAALQNILEDLEKLLELYKKHHQIAKEMWFELCKPFGYNLLDHDLGAVEARTETAIFRVNQYLSGACDKLEELEAEIFYYNGITKPLMEVNTVRSFATVD